MGRIIGGALIAAGVILWYYGGTGGSVSLVNLGIGSIILGLVSVALPLHGAVDSAVLPLVCGPSCEFLGALEKDLELQGDPIVIPPYENLPKGAFFLPRSRNFTIGLGRFGEGTVFVTGSERESGLLISPPPGWGLVEYALENVGELSGTGLGYASSAVASVLSALGLGSAEVFEEEGKINVFVKPLCGSPVYADPVVSAVLVGIALGVEELLRVVSVGRSGEYLKITLERLGGIEKWL
ncbi:hypothetical protein [Thermococcus sp. 21S7]|uniref:hypothetical protein n=1 Tax=Thermococcus sp. 21S7 TaxID=1638221 RepID=UPI00143BFA1A|nr:hypothetical protein [Thermococcus sp. 21S7]NJE62126.1 hypothetical protein [Thermococcus sp. 21S7]